MSRKVVNLDVRPDLKRGCSPFSTIMQAVSGLKPDEDLLLIAPFEPAPLYGVLAQQGFSHQTQTLPNGDWKVRFTRQPGPATASQQTGTPRQAPSSPSPATCSGTPVLELDARGLEPPQPLVKILEALASVPQGATLQALTDRRPMHLYAELEARGFVGTTEPHTHGSFITHISRR